MRKSNVKNNKSYRMLDSEVLLVKKRAKKLCKITEEQISGATLIRALVYLSKNMSDDQLAEACREVM